MRKGGIPINSLDPWARLLIVTGSLILLIGLLMLATSRAGLGLFRLPGDIVIKRDNFTFCFPWVTGLVISVFLSIILGFFGRR